MISVVGACRSCLGFTSGGQLRQLRQLRQQTGKEEASWQAFRQIGLLPRVIIVADCWWRSFSVISAVGACRNCFVVTSCGQLSAATKPRQRGGKLGGLSTDWPQWPVALCHTRRRLLVEEFFGEQGGWSVQKLLCGRISLARWSLENGTRLVAVSGMF